MPKEAPGAEAKGTEPIAEHVSANQTQHDLDEDPLPKGGPREDMVWRSEYFCFGPPGLSCDRHVYEIELDALYGGFSVDVALETPGSTLTNGFYVALDRPTGERAGSTSFTYGVHEGNDTVSIPIDDPSLLFDLGTWTLSLWTVDVAATALVYEARVSFTAHPEHALSDTESPVQTPRTITFNATRYGGANPPMAWDRVADFLPEGFAPRGYPDERIFNGRRGLPDGTLATTGVFFVEYSSGHVDGYTFPSGELAMAWAKAEPPSDYEDEFGTEAETIGMTWVAAVTTDPHVTDALRAWDIPASTGEVSLTTGSTGPYLVVTGNATGDSMDIQMDAHVEQVAPGGGGVNSYRHWSVQDNTLAQAMLWTISPHQGFPGVISLSGTLGALGDVQTVGYGGLLWFGGTDKPTGESGEWRYQLGEWW